LGLLVMGYAVAHIPGFSFAPGHLLLLAVLLASAFGVVVAVFMAFAASGLPAGVAVDAETGIISGTITAGARR
jgi:hypothetical protein